MGRGAPPYRMQRGGMPHGMPPGMHQGPMMDSIPEHQNEINTENANNNPEQDSNSESDSSSESDSDSDNDNHDNSENKICKLETGLCPVDLTRNIDNSENSAM